MMQYFNDRVGFEKFYAKWERKQLGVEDRVPRCVLRLDLDARARQEQKLRDELAKKIRDEQEEESQLRTSNMVIKMKQ